MKFAKPSLTLEQQVSLLLSRGMIGDPAKMSERLAMVNYYRLSAYWHTFRESDGDRFIAGTSFDAVWERYVFDRELRLLVMDAVERLEVAVRARLAYAHAHVNGPFGYAEDPKALFERDGGKRADFLRKLDEEIKRSHELFVAHFLRKYGKDHQHLPVWVIAEVLSFGGVLSFYRGSRHAVRKEVADFFGVADTVFESWLLMMNAVRNICAHHGRLWNRQIGLKPKLPRTSEWQQPVAIPQDRTFAVLTILAYCMHRIAPGSTWAGRVAPLFAAHPGVPMRQVGFPNEWADSPIWKRVLT